jgi:hypothetical protein
MMHQSLLPTKPIILVMSCDRDRYNGRQRACEDTWAREWMGKIPFLFVLGGNAPKAHPFEFVCDAPDDYAGVPEKFKRARAEVIKWNYTHIFHCCTDTWVNVPRLLASGFENHEYTGYRCDEGHGSGGMGYWTGPTATDLLIVAQHTGDYEDRWAGTILAQAGIRLHEDNRYSSPANPNRPADEITLHLSRGTDNYDPQWMYDYHTLWRQGYV